MDKTKEMLVVFRVDIDPEFEEEFKKIVNHHIDALIDLDSYPEIKGINSAETYRVTDVRSI